MAINNPPPPGLSTTAIASSKETLSENVESNTQANAQLLTATGKEEQAEAALSASASRKQSAELNKASAIADQPSELKANDLGAGEQTEEDLEENTAPIDAAEEEIIASGEEVVETKASTTQDTTATSQKSSPKPDQQKYKEKDKSSEDEETKAKEEKSDDEAIELEEATEEDEISAEEEDSSLADALAAAANAAEAAFSAQTFASQAITVTKSSLNAREFAVEETKDALVDYNAAYLASEDADSHLETAIDNLNIAIQARDQTQNEYNRALNDKSVASQNESTAKTAESEAQDAANLANQSVEDANINVTAKEEAYNTAYNNYLNIDLSSTLTDSDVAVLNELTAADSELSLAIESRDDANKIAEDKMAILTNYQEEHAAAEAELTAKSAIFNDVEQNLENDNNMVVSETDGKDLAQNNSLIKQDDEEQKENIYNEKEEISDAATIAHQETVASFQDAIEHALTTYSSAALAKHTALTANVSETETLNDLAHSSLASLKNQLNELVDEYSDINTLVHPDQPLNTADLIPEDPNIKPLDTSYIDNVLEGATNLAKIYDANYTTSEYESLEKSEIDYSFTSKDVVDSDKYLINTSIEDGEFNYYVVSEVTADMENIALDSIPFLEMPFTYHEDSTNNNNNIDDPI